MYKSTDCPHHDGYVKKNRPDKQTKRIIAQVAGVKFRKLKKKAKYKKKKERRKK